jgi:hypothetical protein
MSPLHVNCRRAAVLTVAIIGPAACGTSASDTPAALPSATGSLSDAQGTASCQDIAAWLQPELLNMPDRPRFTARLKADETQAINANSQLGQDMTALDTYMQLVGKVALQRVSSKEAGTPLDQLVSDCQQYGVTLIQ